MASPISSMLQKNNTLQSTTVNSLMFLRLVRIAVVIKGSRSEEIRIRFYQEIEAHIGIWIYLFCPIGSITFVLLTV